MYGSPNYLGYGTSEPPGIWEEFKEAVTYATEGDPPDTSKGLNHLITTIQNTQVRTPQDLAVLSNVVLTAIKLETGKDESAAKYTNLANQSAAATTIPKQVAVLQRLADLAQTKKATRVEDALRQGVAKEYWLNVESQQSTPGTAVTPKSKNVDEMLKLPIYRRRWFVPTVVASALAITVMIWKPWK